MRIAVSVFAMGCVLLAGPTWAQMDTDSGSGGAAAQTPAVKPKPKPPAAAPAVPGAVPGTPAAPPKPKPLVLAKLLEKHAEWTSYVQETKGAKVCFAATPPKEMLPVAVKRTNVFFYLTTWQKDGVRNEASISVGYQVKPNTPVRVVVDGAEFTFFARADKAYIQDPNAERKLLQAMAGGQTMSVLATSVKGTQTTDKYSLAGLDAAVKKIGEVCP
jgi:hypothetical protein